MILEKSDQINELAKALTQFQAKMPGVVMNAENPFLHNKYADLGTIVSTATPITSKFGLSFSQLSFNDGERVGVETILMHVSGQWISSSISLPLGEEKGKTLAQVAGSVITYLRRYSLSSVLGVYTEEDVDGNSKKRTTKKEELTPQEKQRKIVVDEVFKLGKELGGSKDEDVKTILTKYTETLNPNRIEDLESLKKLLVDLKNLQSERSKKEKETK